MSRVAVMQVTDTLEAGGAERMAVNLANLLPRERYYPHLCTTRRDGPLAELVAPDVGRLRLVRKQRFDAGAALRLIAYGRRHNVQLLHAHGTSLFIAIVASIFPPRPAILWHSHFGRYALEDRRSWRYCLAMRRVGGVIAVNEQLAEWSKRRLGVPACRVWYLPNFVCATEASAAPVTLPGTPGNRLVCVANLRPEKDQLTLIRALAMVVQCQPAAHLLLVGSAIDLVYLGLVEKEISRCGLEQHVSLLGERPDVPAILRECDIGVLSSTSEGLPLALIEYGMAGLPAVATRVGQCAEVLDRGQAGMLVSAEAPDQLAQALLCLLQGSEDRTTLGQRFRRRVQEHYSPGRVIEQVCRVYDTVLASRLSEP